MDLVAGVRKEGSRYDNGNVPLEEAILIICFLAAVVATSNGKMSGTANIARTTLAILLWPLWDAGRRTKIFHGMLKMISPLPQLLPPKLERRRSE